MELPPLTYLSFDSLSEGVGASQVLPYVEGLARRGLQVRLHTFEKTAPSEMLRRRLQEQGVSWSIHPFGTLGTAGGLGAVARAAVAVRGAQLLHARSRASSSSHPSGTSQSLGLGHARLLVR